MPSLFPLGVPISAVRRASIFTMTSGAPPCSFFAKGACRNGASCRFSHDLIPGGMPPSQGPPVPGGAPPPPAGGSIDNRPLCRFFLQGTCRHGANCKFSHTGSAAAPGGGPSQPLQTPPSSAPPPPPPSAPPPTVVTIPPGVPVCSIDVECVATGVQHHDRAVAQISLVDVQCTPRLNLLVKPSVPVASYLTPLTGLTQAQLEAHGVPLEQALATLRQHLPKNAVLVGQNIAKDVEWLGLREGVDYGSMVDLAALLRVWNAQFRSHTYFSQDHYASVWLGVTRTEADAHDAVADAVLSMRLFHAYTQIQQDARAVHAMGERALAQKPKPSFAKLNPEWEGCCMGNKQTCKCGAPFFS